MKRFLRYIIALIVIGCVIAICNLPHSEPAELANTIDVAEDSILEAEADSGVVGQTREIPYTEPYKSGYLDTICIAQGKAVVVDYDIDGRYAAIMVGDKSVICTPIVKYDSLAPTSFRIYDIYHYIDVDFAKMSDIEMLKRFNATLAGFTPCPKNYVRTIAGEYKTTEYYTFYVDFPNDSVKNANHINKWLVSVLNTHWSEDGDNSYPKYKGSCSDKNAIARYSADRFFNWLRPECSEMSYVMDMRAKVKTDRYVTYQQYTYVYLGGAHGNYTERIISYDVENNQQIDEDYLFKKDKLPKVKEVVLLTAMKDKHYQEWERTASLDDVIRHFQSGEYDEQLKPNIDLVDISDIGITPNGVVVSYQPYEISCFAAGCFHFIIPYSKLLPYMTDKAKRCIGLQ